MSLTLVEPGLLSLLVDTGRPRWRSLGIPVGGAADRSALALGNALVGNTPDTAQLEFTLAGPTLQARDRTACVVFGAPFPLFVNDIPIATGTTFTLSPGDVLRIGTTTSGVRGYLCVAGGFDAPVVLDSRSTLDPLARGANLTCRESWCESRGLPFVSFVASPGTGRQTAIRVLDGLQRDWFPDDRFFAQDYEISPASNRMGLRLKGESIVRRQGEIASEAVAPGAVQITNDGLPVILGVDGQTIGGYPKVAHVIRADLDLLAQLRPGEKIRFAHVTLEEAETAARERTASLHEWLARLRAADRHPTFC